MPTMDEIGRTGNPSNPWIGSFHTIAQWEGNFESFYLLTPQRTGCWHRIRPSRNCRGLLKRTLGKGKDLMHLFLTHGREPFQKFADGRAPVKVLEQRGNREARSRKAPNAAQFGWVTVHGAAACPVHKLSLPPPFAK